MNKIYKVIFNRNKNRYEIVSELASSRGGKCKVKAGKQIGKLFMTSLLATFLSSVALAADEEVKVKYDAATGTIKIVKVSDGSEVASYAVGGNISSIDPNKGTYPTGTISLGQGSKVLQNNTIAIGTDAYAGDADGSVTQSDGKIAIGNKTVASGDRSIALGNKSVTNDGSYNIVQGNDSIGIGTSTSVFGYSGVSIGRRNIIGVPDPDLVNNRVLTTKSKTPDKKGVDKEAAPGGNSVIVGAYNVAYGSRSSIIGTYSRAMGSNSVAIGSGVQSLSDGSIAIGKGSGYEFEDASRSAKKNDNDENYYGRDWELPPEYKVLKQVLRTDIADDKTDTRTSSRKNGYFKNKQQPKYNNYGAGSSDPGGFIVEGQNALGIGTYTQVRGDSAIGLATGEMTADLSLKDKSAYARDMGKIMDMEETLYEAKEKLKAEANNGDKEALEDAVKAAEKSLAAAKKTFRETYLKKYSFVDGDGALGVGRQILAQGDRSMAVGDYAKAISSDAIAYGGQTLANGTNSMAMGGKARVGTETNDFDNSMAIGSHTNVQAGNAVALGAFSEVTGENSLALGFGKQSGDDINYNAVSGKNSTLIGSYGTVKGNNSILIGSSGSIANDRVVALGNNIHIAKADENDQVNNTSGSVFLGDHAGYVTDSKRARSLGKVDVVGSNEKMELTESLSSTKGALRDYTKDFIYIYMLERQDDGTQIGAPIAVRSDFAGGDSTVGVVSVGSTYEQNFKNIDEIREYHTKVGSLITVPVDVEVEVTKNGIKLGKQNQTRYFAADATQDQINSDSTLSDEDKTKVWNTIQENLKKTDTKYTVFETRRIQNVAPGLIGSNSTDAINGSQLFATNQMLGNLVGSLKKALGDNVTITPDGQIDTKDEDNTPFTLGWIAKAGSVEGSNGTVAYEVDRAENEKEEDHKAKVNNLKSTGYVVDAAKTMTFKAGKNIGLVQKPGELSISTIDTPSFKSVELRGETKEVNGSQETPVTMLDSSGMQVYTETITPGDAGPTTTKKVSTTVNNEGVTTDGTVKVTNGKDGNQAKDLVTIGKNVDPNAPAGTDGENGTIGLDGKNGSNATITVDRGTSSLDDTKNIGGTDPKQDISENNPAKMDRITYTTKNKEGNDVTHEVATLDDGFMLTTSTDIANSKAPANVKLNNTIKFTDGANTKVSTVTSTDGVHELHVDVNGLPMSYVDNQGKPLTKIGDTFYRTEELVDGKPPAGAKGVPDTEVTSNVTMLDKNGKNVEAPQIKNVGSGLVNGNKAMNPSDLLNTADDAPVLKNAVNVGDLKQVAAAVKTEVTGTGKAIVTNTTAQDGHTIYNVHVDPVVNVVAADGKTQVVRGDDGKYYDTADIKNKTFVPDGKGGGSWYNDDDVVNGVPTENATPQVVEPADVKNSFVNPNSNESIVVDNVKSGIGGDANNGIKDGTTVDGTQGKNTFIKNLDKVGDTGEGAIDKTTVVNAGDLKNLADTPLFFSGDAADGKNGNAKNTFGRKLSEEAKIVGGVTTPANLTDNNIGVVSNGSDTLTIKLAKQLTGLDSATYTSPTTKADDGDATSTMKVDGNGIRFVGDNNAVKNDAPSLTTDGIDGGNKQITNIGSGLKNGDTTISISDLKDPNKVPPTSPVLNNAVNVGDLKNIIDTGFKLNTSGQGTAGATTVRIGDTIKVVDGANTKVSAIDDSTTGTYTFHIDVTGMPISYTDNQGNALTKIGDKYYKNTDIENGKPTTNATEVPADEVTNNIKVINKDGTTNNQGTISNVKSVFDSNIGNGADTGSKIDEIKDGSVISNTGSNQFINDLTKLNDQVDPKATDAEAEKIRAKKDEEKLNSVSTVRDLQKVALTPLFFEGDVAQDEKTANTFDRKLSEKTKIVGEVKHGLADTASAEDKANAIRAKLSDGNIGVVSNGTDTLTIKLAKNLVNLTSVETGSGDNKTKMTKNGITTTVKDGDTFKVTTTTPNGLTTTEEKLDINNKPTGKSTTTMVTTDGVTITTQTPKNGDKPASTTETKLSKDGLATDGTIKVIGDNAKDLVTIAKGAETDPKATDKEFGTVTIDGKNDSKATLTVDRGTKSVTDSANVGKDPTKPIDEENPVAGMDRLTYTTTGADGKSIINHQVATLDDGFFLTTEHTKADETRTVLFNNTIKVLDGANTKVSAMGGENGTHTFSIDVTGLPMTYTATDANGKTQDVHKVGDTYTLADGTKLVQVGDKFYKPDQVEEVNGTPQVKADQEDKDTKLNNISLTSPVANTAPTLSNVGSALKKSDGTRITMSDLDDGNVYPTDNPIWNNAVNVGDLKAATDAARTEVTGTGKAIVTKKTGDQGQNIYNVHVDPIVDVVGADGSKVVRGDDGKYYNPTDIANKTYIPNADGNGGNWYDNGDLTNGVPNQGAKPQNVTPTDVKNNFVNPNGTDSIVLDNVKSGIGGEVKDAAGKNTFIDNINKVGKKNPDGTVAPDAISENTVVNAKDLKNVVDTGFKLNTSGHSGNAQTVKIGETIKVVDGANTKVSDITPKDGVHEFHIDVTGLPMTYTVSQTGGTDAPVSVSKVGDTYQLADGTKLVKVGDKFYKPSQLVDPKAEQPQVKPEEENKDWTVNDSISLVNKEGSNNAPTLKNVGSGLKDANGNSTTLDQAVGSNAVNVDDLRTLGKAATTEVTGTGAAEVTKVTGANGQNIYNVHVDKLMTVKPVDPKANITRGGDGKYYNKDDIAGKTFVSDGNGGGSWYNASDVDAKTGKPLEGKSALAKQPIALDQSKLKNSVVNPNGDGATIVDNVKSGIGGEVKDTSGKNTFIENLDKVGKPANEGGIDKTTVVNAGDLKNLADTPLFFSGDAADDKEYNGVKNTKNTFGRKLSEEAKIVGGQTDITKLTDNNIGVVSNGTDTLTIKLAKELQNLTSVTTGSGDNTTVMNQDGVTITTQTPQNGDKPASTTETKLSKDGLATDGTIKVTGDNAKDLVTIGKGTETDQNATDKEFGTVTIDGKNGSNATLTVDRGTSSLDDTKNIGTDPNQDISENNPAKMDRITYTTKNKDGKDVTHEVATLDDGFFLTTSTDVAKGKAAAGVKLNHTIKFTDGANTKVSTVDSKDGIHELHVDVTGLPMTYTVSQTGGTDAPVSVSKVGDTYQLADGTKLVKVGDKFYKPSQLVNPKADQPEVKPDEVAKDWSVNDSVSLVNKDGSTNAPTLKNVGSGLKDANGNSTTLDQAVGSNAVNVDDLRTMGKAATTEVTGTGAAEVTKVTGANGQNIYNVHVERFMQVAETDVEGNKVVKAADNHYYKEADIKDKTYIDGQWYNNTDIKDKTKIGDKWYNADDVVNGVPEPNATELTVQATTAPNKAVGLQNNLVNPNDNKPTRLSNLASALSGEVGNGANPADNSAINGIDKNGKPTSESGSNTFVKNVLDLDATEKTVEQLKTSLGHEPSEDEVKAEKARAEKDKALLNSAVTVADLQKTLQSPLFFEGDSADGVANENGSDKNTFARKLSQKTKIVGGVDLGLKENATAEERKKAIAEKLTDHNIGVISNGTDTLTIKLAKDLTDLHSVTTTDDKGNTTQINGKGLATTADGKITTVTSDGITIVTTDKDGNNNVSLTNKGLDNGHHQIINVKSGLLDRQGNPVTLKNASGDILNNAVNVKDLRDVVQGLTDSGKGGGFGLTGNNGEVHKSLGETITLKGGIANKLENGIDMNKPEKATTDKNTYIDVKTSKNGSEKIMVVEIAKDLTDLNSAEFTDQEGNTTKMKGDGIYIDKNGDGNADISLTSEGLNNGGNKITNVADGTEDTDAVNVSQLNKLKQEIKQNIGDEINELNAYAPVVYSDKEGNRVIRKGNKFVKKNDETAEIPPQDIRLSLVNADGKTTTPSTLQNVAKGVNPTDAVNVEQLEEATEKPLTFNGDAGSSSAKLGETVAIKGGANSADLTDNNIGVIANSSTKTLNVKLSKKLKGLESAEFVDNNGNTTNITGDGVHISGGNGSNVSLTSQGLNNGGNRITNVAPGVEATDAVNVSQLNQVGAALHNRINNVAKGAYGGVASAGAMASLPQAYLPGKSMVAAGASHYRGESAVALGASRISDNGKIILKLNASHNTSGNTMVGAGVGYQF
ncbi:YadA-like family protein [Gallibacterium anatis]|uniref:YadA-like family protein n=1 Tax=Gallibacterium anatis TaxID=750 RepID=UPI003006CB74